MQALLLMLLGSVAMGGGGALLSRLMDKYAPSPLQTKELDLQKLQLETQKEQFGAERQFKEDVLSKQEAEKQQSLQMSLEAARGSIQQQRIAGSSPMEMTDKLYLSKLLGIR